VRPEALLERSASSHNTSGAWAFVFSDKEPTGKARQCRVWSFTTSALSGGLTPPEIWGYLGKAARDHQRDVIRLLAGAELPNGFQKPVE
jgi:hypothetical protein